MFFIWQVSFRMGFHIVNQSIQLDLSKIAMLEKKNIPRPGVSSAKSKDSKTKSLQPNQNQIPKCTNHPLCLVKNDCPACPDSRNQLCKMSRNRKEKKDQQPESKWASYSSPTGIRSSATRMRKKMATAQSQSLRVMTNTGTSGSFSRVRCSCIRSEDMLRKLATETTSNDAAVSRLMVAWFCVAW